jgi:excisionase family DNA binding protein
MLTVKQAAERLCVSPSTVYNLVHSGQLHCHRIGLGRGRIRFTETQVEAYLQACEVGAGTLRPEAMFTHPQR